MTRLEHKKDSGKWDRRYMGIAREVAGWSKHPDTRVGACAVGDFGQILSTGYNGWPRGIVDERVGDQDGPSYTIHAESNLIFNASLTGTVLRGSTVYVFPLFPCVECAKALIQVGVVRAVYYPHAFIRQPYEDGSFGPALPLMLEAWQESWGAASELFRQAQVEVTSIDV